MENRQNDQNNDDNKKKGELKVSVIVCLMLVLGMFMLLLYTLNKINETHNVEITYGEFIEINEHSSLFQVLFSYFDIKDTHEESETILYFAEQ